MSEKSNLTVAIQKNGRLNYETVQLLSRCGVETSTGLFQCNDNVDIDIYSVRDDDIPILIADRICDVGIVGQNVFLERKAELEASINSRVRNFEVLKYLGFGKCRLSFAVPQDVNFENLADLNGRKIATSYPYLLKKFLLRNNLEAEIVYLSGSVEIAPKLKIADLICDLVATGNTLKDNDLREVYCMLSSEAVLLSSTAISPRKKAMLSVLLERMNNFEANWGQTC